MSVSCNSKKELRQKILSQRRELAPEQKELASQKMLAYMENWPIFLQAKAIHIFLTQAEEPNTRPIFELGWKLGKLISVPCVLPETMELFHSQLNTFDDLKPGAYGIMEPALNKRISINPEIYDLVIVPGVAFDKKGGRVGYGKGYYDRFLSRTAAFRLALSFDLQVLDKVPTEAHDVPMNGILTENGFQMMIQEKK